LLQMQVTSQTITGDGSTGYTLDRAVANGKELLVYINNVKQEEGSGKSYTASGTTITFSEAVASGDSCYLVYMGSAQQTVTAPAGSIVSGQIANAELVLPNDLKVTGNVTFNDDSADKDFRVESNGNANMLFVDGGNDSVVIGHSDANDGSVSSAFALQNIGTDYNSSSMGLARFSADVNAPSVVFHKSRNASIGGDTVVQDDDEIGRIRFFGNDGTDFAEGARITALVDGSPGNNDMPGRLVFSVTADSSSSPSERMRLDAGGDFRIGIPTQNPGDGTRGTIITQDNGLLVTGFSEALRIYSTSSGSPNAAITANGVLSKTSGSFKIDHPLESKKDTHHLVHSFVEAPEAANIYRGKVTLSSGSATVNVDTVSGMTEGTFVALNTDVQCFTSNESGWTAIKGSVSGNILTITAQDNSCTDIISWMIVGRRHDPHMKDSGTDWTDSDGKVIVEPEKGSE